mgnify:CR=1 FL=1
MDVVSGGELFKALRAGFAPEDILFGGVGKQAHELREAITAANAAGSRTVWSAGSTTSFSVIDKDGNMIGGHDHE